MTARTEGVKPRRLVVHDVRIQLVDHAFRIDAEEERRISHQPDAGDLPRAQRAAPARRRSALDQRRVRVARILGLGRSEEQPDPRLGRLRRRNPALPRDLASRPSAPLSLTSLGPSVCVVRKITSSVFPFVVPASESARGFGVSSLVRRRSTRPCAARRGWRRRHRALALRSAQSTPRRACGSPAGAPRTPAPARGTPAAQ